MCLFLVLLSFILIIFVFKKQRRNELLGLEGMVKLKNPDDNLVVNGNSEASAEVEVTTVTRNVSEIESKRYIFIL